MGVSETTYTGVELDDVVSPVASSSRDNRHSNVDYLRYKGRIHRHRILSRAADGLEYICKGQTWRQFFAFMWTAIKDAKTDIMSVAWLKLLSQLFYTLWPLASMIFLLWAIFVVSTGSFFPPNGACQPDGSFDAGPNAYYSWGLSGIFQITLGFGTLSFSSVKAIDATWDVFVGRGGQAILAFLSYRVFTKALVRSMESASVPYGTFQAITLQNGSLTAVFRIIIDIASHPGIRVKFMFCWMIISAIFVLAYPTLVSAMSGYTPNITSFIQVDDGNMVPFANFNIVRYVIHDAPRISSQYQKDYPIITSRDYRNDVPDAALSGGDTGYDYCQSQGMDEFANYTVLQLPDLVDAACLELWQVSMYTSENGLLGLNNTNTTLYLGTQTFPIKSPSLNISAYYYYEDGTPSWLGTSDPYYQSYFGFNWEDPRTHQQPFHHSTPPFWSNLQYTYTLPELNERGRCQQKDTTYKWGFSFLLLFWTLLAFNIWAIGAYIMYLDAFLNSRFDHAGRQMGLRRAVLDLASAMRKDMGEEATEMLSDPDLAIMTRRALNGGRISYNMLDNELLPLTRATELRMWWSELDKRKWARDEIFWIIALLLGFILSVINPSTEILFPFPGAVAITAAALIGIYLGRKTRSRWIFLMLALIVTVASSQAGPYYCTRNYDSYLDQC